MQGWSPKWTRIDVKCIKNKGEKELVKGFEQFIYIIMYSIRDNCDITHSRHLQITTSINTEYIGIKSIIDAHWVIHTLSNNFILRN